MKDLLEIFTLELQVRGLAEVTIKNKINRLTKFCNYIDTLDNLNKINVNKYIATLDVKDSSKKEYIKTIKTFIDYLAEEGYTERIKIHQFKTDKIIQQHISYDDIQRILRYLSKDKSFLGVRNYTMVCVLIDCGLRISELVSLDISDIEGSTMKVKCKRKERLVPISPKLKLQLKKYLILRDKYAKEDKALFITRSSNRLQVISVQKIIKDIAESLDINIHAHLFRHYFIQNLLKNNVNIYYISRIVGHESISTTETYLRSMEQEEIINNLKNYSNLC